MPKNKKGGDKKVRTQKNKKEDEKSKKPISEKLTTKHVEDCIFNFIDLKHKNKKTLSKYICNKVPRMPVLPMNTYNMYFNEEWPNQILKYNLNEKEAKDRAAINFHENKKYIPKYY